MTDRFKSRRWTVRRPRVRFAAACVLAALLLPHFLQAQQDERSVRAAFVYNLTKYVTWPAGRNELNICVVGSGVTGPALKQIVEGKKSDGRAVHVLLQPSDIELRHCDIVYLSDSTTASFHSCLSKVHNTPTLTVGEDERFVGNGGMVAFVRSGDSIQIEVNLDSVQAAGLKISSRFLNLALIVHPKERD